MSSMTYNMWVKKAATTFKLCKPESCYSSVRTNGPINMQ